MESDELQGLVREAFEARFEKLTDDRIRHAVDDQFSRRLIKTVAAFLAANLLVVIGFVWYLSGPFENEVFDRVKNDSGTQQSIEERVATAIENKTDDIDAALEHASETQKESKAISIDANRIAAELKFVSRTAAHEYESLNTGLRDSQFEVEELSGRLKQVSEDLEEEINSGIAKNEEQAKRLAGNIEVLKGLLDADDNRVMELATLLQKAQSEDGKSELVAVLSKVERLDVDIQAARKSIRSIEAVANFSVDPEIRDGADSRARFHVGIASCSWGDLGRQSISVRINTQKAGFSGTHPALFVQMVGANITSSDFNVTLPEPDPSAPGVYRFSISSAQRKAFTSNPETTVQKWLDDRNLKIYWLAVGPGI